MFFMYTDNQPDFTWLKPHEEKTFVQYFMPYKGVGRVGNATKDAAVSLTRTEDGRTVLKVYVTGDYAQASIQVTEKEQILYSHTTDLSPKTCFEAEIPAPSRLSDCTVKVSCGQKTLVSYSVYEKKPEPIPSPADPLPAPEKLATTEDLYLAATHLEQYRHATREPADYYLEGLKRDATDIRLNNGYGLLLLRRGQVKESIPYFQSAVKKQTWKNPNPYSGECYFNLGLAYEANGGPEKAYDAFFKSIWSAETQSAGIYWLACLSARKGELEDALKFVEQSMIRNWHNMKARTLKAALLRLLKKDNSTLLSESLSIDPLYMGCLYEKALAENSMADWKHIMRPEAHNHLELALDYEKAGLYQDALQILQSCKDDNPMILYYQGYMYSKLGNDAAAADCFASGEHACPDCCFPNRVEEIAVLKAAIDKLPQAPMAHYYLGCLYYDKKQYCLATEHWEAAVKENNSIAMVFRNLSIAYYNKQQDGEKALTAMEKACQLDSTYPRYLLEYDQLAARLNLPVSDRLARMEAQHDLLKERDDLYLRYITLLNNTGRYQEAYDALMSHHFHPWEGGEGKVSAQYRYALIHLAKNQLAAGNPETALQLLNSALTYPKNLGEGKLPNVPDNQIHYFMGMAFRQTGESAKAEEYFRLAASGPQEPSSVLYYNDQPSDFIYYQGLAARALGNDAAARKAFHKLISFGEQHLFDEVEYDFFAVSLPEIEVYQEDIRLRNVQYCNYLRALGSLGLGKNEKAEELFAGILEKQGDYQGALEHRTMKAF